MSTPVPLRQPCPPGACVCGREQLADHPQAAQRINPNDAVRVIRALEVLEQSGQSIITLQQKHWDWLDQQNSSASAVIRKLIDKELNNPASESNIMLARQATDRFMSAMSGNMPNYEEATRALYQGDQANFLKMIQDYPKEIHQYILKLSTYAF